MGIWRKPTHESGREGHEQTRHAVTQNALMNMTQTI